MKDVVVDELDVKDVVKLEVVGDVVVVEQAVRAIANRKTNKPMNQNLFIENPS